MQIGSGLVDLVALLVQQTSLPLHGGARGEIRGPCAAPLPRAFAAIQLSGPLRGRRSDEAGMHSQLHLITGSIGPLRLVDKYETCH